MENHESPSQGCPGSQLQKSNARDGTVARADLGLTMFWNGGFMYQEAC